MPIKHKALLILLGITFFTFVAVNLLLFVFITYNFQKVEDSEAVKDLNRVQYLLDSFVKDTEVKAIDYAIWDDSYQFVKDLNTKYIQNNYRPEIFKNLNLTYMLFFDETGKFIYGKHYDENSAEITDVTTNDVTEFAAIIAQNTEKLTSGYAFIHDEPNYYAAHELLSSTGEGPAHGFLLFSKEFGETDANRISGLSNLKVDFTSINMLPDAEKRRIADYYQKYSHEIYHSKNTLTVFGIVADNNDLPVLLIKVEEFRYLYTKAIDLFLSIWALYFGITIVAVALWTYYSDKLIFKRIKNLAKQVYQMKLSRGFEQRVKVEGNDEISQLSSNINDLLTALSKADDNYLVANESLKNKAAELQKKTEELEKLNQFMVGREVKMAQLKKEIEILKNKLERKI